MLLKLIRVLHHLSDDKRFEKNNISLLLIDAFEHVALVIFGKRECAPEVCHHIYGETPPASAPGHTQPSDTTDFL